MGEEEQHLERIPNICCINFHICDEQKKLSLFQSYMEGLVK